MATVPAVALTGLADVAVASRVAAVPAVAELGAVGAVASRIAAEPAVAELGAVGAVASRIEAVPVVALTGLAAGTVA